MKTKMIFSILCGLFIIQSTYAQDLAFVEGPLKSSKTVTSNYPNPVNVQAQEATLHRKLGAYIQQILPYPSLAREEVMERTLKTTIAFDKSLSRSSIQIQGEQGDGFERELKKAFSSQDVLDMIPSNYQGRKVFRITIRFKLDY